MNKKIGLIIVLLVIITIFLGFISTRTHANYTYNDACKNKEWDYCKNPTPTLKIKSCFINGEEISHICPTLTPTVTPIATPSAIPTSNPSQGIVSSNQSTNTTQPPGSPVCNISFDSPKLQGFKSNGTGSIIFSWWGVSNIDKYSIRYGYSSNELIYGEDNIPSSSTSITLNDLRSGSNVWAIVSAWRGGCAEDSNILDPLIK